MQFTSVETMKSPYSSVMLTGMLVYMFLDSVRGTMVSKVLGALNCPMFLRKSSKCFGTKVQAQALETLVGGAAYDAPTTVIRLLQFLKTIPAALFVKTLMQAIGFFQDFRVREHLQIMRWLLELLVLFSQLSFPLGSSRLPNQSQTFDRRNNQTMDKMNFKCPSVSSRVFG